MFNFLAPWIPARRKPVVETVVQQAAPAPQIPRTLIAKPLPTKPDKPG